MQCEIILIGNELLIGKIRDTNGSWIIYQLLPLGAEITRITTIKDDLNEISSTLRDAISRNPRYIFTSGGLGPTFDDMTLEGISRGLNPPQSLKLNDIALNMIKKRYRKIYPNIPEEKLLKPSRIKMARIPLGSIPLHNSEGTAPGVLVNGEFTNGNTKVICMPGIPIELKAIFNEHVLEMINNDMKGEHFNQCSFTFRYIGESKFTEIVSEIVSNGEFPEIWIKTHPKKKEDKTVELHLTSFSSSKTIPEQMHELYERLKNHVLKNNGTITHENPLE